MIANEAPTAPATTTHAHSRLDAAADRLIEAVLWLTLAGLCAGVFVGLAAMGYWIDELWSLWVAGPSNSTAEVVRRALMDSHPPAYYLALHAWTRLVGDGEAATRLLSALCAVGAIAVFLSATGAAFSRPARLFAAIAGASSLFWFDQSQNLRSYALGVLIVSALLGCALQARVRGRAGTRPSLYLCAALAGLGAVGAFVHFYLFLTVGLIYFALLVSVADLRLRVVLVGAGCAIAAGVLAWVRAQQAQTLFTQSWFTNDPRWLAAAIGDAAWSGLGQWSKRALALLTAVAAWGWLHQRGRGSERLATPALTLRLARWLGVVGVGVGAGLTAAGLMISLLLEPSFSGRNLLIASPCAWCAAAWIYDEAMAWAPRRIGLAAAGLAAIASALNLGMLDGRLLNRREDWRGSAYALNRLTTCRGRDVPVVTPAYFAPDSPLYRRMTRETFYGRYYRGGGRLVPVTRAELAGPRGGELDRQLSARARGADPCPILAWAVHDLTAQKAAALGRALAARPDIGRPVTVRYFPAYLRVGSEWRASPSSAYLFEVAGAPAPQDAGAGLGRGSGR